MTESRARAAAILGIDNTPLEIVARPRKREDCAKGPRPCPFVACSHHLFLDVDPYNGSIKLNFPDQDISDLEETCALDVADRGALSHDAVGELINLTRERVRQIEIGGLQQLRVVATRRWRR